MKEIMMGKEAVITSFFSTHPLFKVSSLLNQTWYSTHGILAMQSTREMSPKSLGYFLYTLWLFTVSDHKTFVVPEALFGILGALSGPLLTDNPDPNICQIVFQVPKVFLWTWLNTFVFDLANQRHVESVEEDRLNKPFRPLAAGRITPTQTKQLLLVSIPVVLVVTYFYLGSYEETVLLFSLTWMYNYLG